MVWMNFQIFLLSLGLISHAQFVHIRINLTNLTCLVNYNYSWNLFISGQFYTCFWYYFLGYWLLMSYEIFNLNGYGFFVWPAFIFTFVICFVLYLKTSKEFKKYEKMFFNQYQQVKVVKIKTAIEKKALSNSPIF